MNILTIAAVAAGLYFLSSSKKSETSQKDSKGDLVIKADPVTPTPKPSDGIVGDFKPPKPPIVPKDIGGISVLGCTSNQYEKDGKCVTFWDDKTEGLVVGKIMKKAQEWYDSVKGGPIKPENNVGEGYITLLCSDQNDGKGNFETNPQAMKIMIETVAELWPVITKDALPPTQKSPKWLIEVWNRVVQIYYREICGL